MTAPSPTGDLADRLENAIKAVDAPSNKHGQDFRDERDKRLEGLGEEVCQIGAELVAALRASAPADPGAGRDVDVLNGLREANWFDRSASGVPTGPLADGGSALKSAAPAEDVGRGDEKDLAWWARKCGQTWNKLCKAEDRIGALERLVLPTADREAIREAITDARQWIDDSPIRNTSAKAMVAKLTGTLALLGDG